MRSIILACLGAVCVFGSNAQTTLAEIQETPEKAGGVYYAYPVPECSRQTEAPDGYQPFYISHYGRHGSRYLISDRDYSDIMDKLHRADSAAALTSLGIDVMHRLDSVWLEARGRGGELTPLGHRQHHGIAGRMICNFPEVFPDNAVVTAASTPVMRCAHSMFAFIEGIKEQNPRLDIPRESSVRNLYYLNYHSPESEPYSSDKGEWYKDYVLFKKNKTNPDRLMASLFSDMNYLENEVDASEMMTALYWLAVDMQNMETAVSFLDIFTPEELYDLWQIYNFSFYATNCSYPGAHGLHVANAANLVRDIIENADKYISDNVNGATLRFGHDGNIIPLAAFLHLENCYAEQSDPNLLAGEYANFKVSPMASNIQMVFYRDVKGDVLVKFLLNERETAIDIPTDTYPYYPWEEVRDVLDRRCVKAGR
ncbi:MAG: histidine-type phosphatase [Muribaculaceae bacterium]|nr:histidine-type phosphatase [Muribaculaceae bacterium]